MSHVLPHIIIASTSIIATDQRLQRIATSLAAQGCRVTWLGRHPDYQAPSDMVYEIVDVTPSQRHGPRFYYQINSHIYREIMARQPDIVCSVDLDTLWAVGRAAARLDVPMVYDAHEYYTQVPELAGKPLRRWLWSYIGRRYIPRAVLAYTVNDSLAQILSSNYGRAFGVVRSVPWLHDCPVAAPSEGRRLHYQGVLNRGRTIELYIDAMEALPASMSLHLYGEGDLSDALRTRAALSPRALDIHFYGRLAPDALRAETPRAWLGLNLLDDSSLNYRYSLANKFFDYMHASVPSINSPLPEYQRIISSHDVGLTVCMDDYVGAIMALDRDPDRYEAMQQATQVAKQEYHWHVEQQVLIDLWSDFL